MKKIFKDNLNNISPIYSFIPPKYLEDIISYATSMETSVAAQQNISFTLPTKNILIGQNINKNPIFNISLDNNRICLDINNSPVEEFNEILDKLPEVVANNEKLTHALTIKQDEGTIRFFFDNIEILSNHTMILRRAADNLVFEIGANYLLITDLDGNFIHAFSSKEYLSITYPSQFLKIANENSDIIKYNTIPVNFLCYLENLADKNPLALKYSFKKCEIDTPSFKTPKGKLFEAKKFEFFEIAEIPYIKTGEIAEKIVKIYTLKNDTPNSMQPIIITLASGESIRIFNIDLKKIEKEMPSIPVQIMDKDKFGTKFRTTHDISLDKMPEIKERLNMEKQDPLFYLDFLKSKTEQHSVSEQNLNSSENSEIVEPIIPNLQGGYSSRTISRPVMDTTGPFSSSYAPPPAIDMDTLRRFTRPVTDTTDPLASFYRPDPISETSSNSGSRRNDEGYSFSRNNTSNNTSNGTYSSTSPTYTPPQHVTYQPQNRVPPQVNQYQPQNNPQPAPSRYIPDGNPTTEYEINETLKYLKDQKESAKFWGTISKDVFRSVFIGLTCYFFFAMMNPFGSIFNLIACVVCGIGNVAAKAYSEHCETKITTINSEESKFKKKLEGIRTQQAQQARNQTAENTQTNTTQQHSQQNQRANQQREQIF